MFATLTEGNGTKVIVTTFATLTEGKGTKVIATYLPL